MANYGPLIWSPGVQKCPEINNQYIFNFFKKSYKVSSAYHTILDESKLIKWSPLMISVLLIIIQKFIELFAANYFNLPGIAPYSSFN